ncbi:MAG: superoxide dismutase family protein [Pseudomonadota bacterium]
MKAPLLALLIPLAVLAACSRTETPTADVPPPAAAPAPQPTATEPAAAQPVSATVKLAGASGSSVAGELQLTATDGGVAIAGEITGLTPGTQHGFHVHETGDCSAPDAKSAGGHFNPAHVAHGGPTSDVRHLGDIPNIQSDSAGHVTVSATIPGATLRDGAADDLVGKAMIVHAKPDDYTTQPSGDAGDRIACGVIQ